MTMRSTIERGLGLLWALALGLGCGGIPAEPLLGIDAPMLQADFWIAQSGAPDTPVLDRDRIEALNAAMRAGDPSFHRVDAFADSIDGDAVRRRIEALAGTLPEALFDEHGNRVGRRARRALLQSLALDRIDERVGVEYALVVRRAALRRYPTAMRVFHRAGDIDIDRFQESALFVGQPVALLHRSRDRRWRFVVSERYAAWVRADAVAIGTRDAVLGYASRRPALTVIGTRAHTVHSRTRPLLSRRSLDMGVRLPLREDWPQDRPIGGQLGAAAWVVDVPVRGADGRLVIEPALIARGEAVREQPLAFTQRQLLVQAFRFVGERYGWGHGDAGRDCSGFVSDVFASLGIVLPRNTGDQMRSPLLAQIDLAGADAAARREALAMAAVGDLLYLPGHVMMVIGRVDGALWVIHDVHAVHVRDDVGALRRLPLNAVSVTPLAPLLTDAGTPYTEALVAIVRVQPRSAAP
jgi:cell wall-associated NlpC family hydrolase